MHPGVAPRLGSLGLPQNHAAVPLSRPNGLNDIGPSSTPAYAGHCVIGELTGQDRLQGFLLDRPLLLLGTLLCAALRLLELGLNALDLLVPFGQLEGVVLLGPPRRLLTHVRHLLGDPALDLQLGVFQALRELSLLPPLLELLSAGTS